ncbi:MAG: hypothetical protein KDE23_15025 [Caldilinea sp.]|nr:hypothetical protein [Caldilinea sp.]
MTEEQPRSGRRWPVVLLALGALAVLCVCGFMALMARGVQDAPRADVTGVTRTAEQPAEVEATAAVAPSPTPLAGVGDVVSQGGITWAALAASQRDTYLAASAYPLTDIGAFEVREPGAITNLRGGPADLALVRAGDRLRLVDGPYAGQVILLTGTEWRDGVLRCTPEGDYSLPQLVG